MEGFSIRSVEVRKCLKLLSDYEFRKQNSYQQFNTHDLQSNLNEKDAPWNTSP
jgi:hypothetical protein